MTIHKICCDHCGKEISTMRDFYDIEIEMHHKSVKVDLCVECIEELCRIVCEFCNKKYTK